MRPHLATLVEDFRRHGRQTAVVTHVGNRSLPTSYAELATLSARFAAALERQGVRQGDRVLLWGRNSAEWSASFFGCLLRGVLAVPLDAAGSAEFARRVVRETTPRLLIGDAALLGQIRDANAPALPFEDVAATLPPPDYRPVEGLSRATPLQIVFTSGTTAEPKGIVHTHGNVLASLDPIEREMAKYLKYERLVHPLRFLHTLPLSHVFGQFMGLWIPPLLAAELHFEARLDAPRLIRLIKTRRISVLAAVPRVLELLRAHLLHLDPGLPARIESARADGASALGRWWRFRRQHRLLGLKFWAFVCGGATLPGDLEHFWTGLGFALVQGYGMTETTALVTLNHPFRTARGAIGKPLAGREVRIAPDGEILVRGESVASAEWRSGALRPRSEDEGWLATGDLATRNEAGDLVFTGRKSDIIVTGAGLNIHPQDLEAALLRDPSLRAAAVVPFETAAGPQPLAVLIPEPQPAAAGGSKQAEAAAEAAVQRANATLADFQQIRRWLVWPQADLPRTTTGKVLRRQIAAWAKEALAGGQRTAPEHDPLLAAIRAIPGASFEGPIGDDSRLSEDLHLDSLSLVELQTELETRFGVEIDELAWQQARTVEDLRSLLQTPAGAGPAAVAPMRAASAVAAGQSPPEARPEAAAPGTGQGVLPARAAAPAKPGAAATDYPRWPWSRPIRWIRELFLAAVSRPLTRLLAAPRVERLATADDFRQPLLIIANHVTAFDVPLVLYALPAPARRKVAVAMAAHILLGWRRARADRHQFLRFATPPAYWLVTALYNAFPLPQGAGFRRAFSHAGEALDRGMSVLVFPEGRRSEGELGPFQSGIGLLAQESGVPVLPVYLAGLGEMKRNRRWFRSGKLTVRVGRPLRIESGETPQAFTQRLEAAMRALSEG